MLSDIDFAKIKDQKGDFELLQPGDYLVVSDNAEIKETKAGTGEMISIKYKVLGGEFDGRFLFDNYLIKHENPKAVEVGLQRLKGFMKAANMKKDKLTDVVELVGYKATAVVKIQKSSDYGDSNRISWFKPIESKEAVNGDVPF